MDSGLAASRRPGMTPDAIQTSETLHQGPVGAYDNQLDRPRAA
jgi:hypothetical protein